MQTCDRMPARIVLQTAHMRIADGTLYESTDYHNAVFIGKDESGTPKYDALRSTLGSTFKHV